MCQDQETTFLTLTPSDSLLWEQPRWAQSINRKLTIIQDLVSTKSTIPLPRRIKDLCALVEPSERIFGRNKSVKKFQGQEITEKILHHSPTSRVVLQTWGPSTRRE